MGYLEKEQKEFEKIVEKYDKKASPKNIKKILEVLKQLTDKRDSLTKSINENTKEIQDIQDDITQLLEKYDGLVEGDHRKHFLESEIEIKTELIPNIEAHKTLKQIERESISKRIAVIDSKLSERAIKNAETINQEIKTLPDDITNTLQEDTARKMERAKQIKEAAQKRGRGME